MLIRRQITVWLLMMLLTGCTKEAKERAIHPDQWDDPLAEMSHVSKIMNSGVKSCKSCHGEDLLGGTSEVSCNSCHQSGKISGHALGWTNTGSDDFHGRFFWDNGFDLTRCQNCHGENLTGGGVELSCSTCHSNPVESCTLCHGGAGHAYPPPSIQNETDPTLITVGAHEAHFESEITDIQCNRCHIVPSHLLDDGHLDGDNIAEVTFDTLATGFGSLTPVWDINSATCANVYCHGSFVFKKTDSNNFWAYAEDSIQGNFSTVTWTVPNSVSCGVCHDLPPKGHLSSTTCGSCHSSVVGTDHFSIIDKTLHINGQKNYP